MNLKKNSTQALPVRAGAAAALPSFATRVLPVVTLTSLEQAVPLAQALLQGGVDAIEVTLRTAVGLQAIEAIAKSVPAICVGAGSILEAADMARAQSAGAQFALSPGCTAALAESAQALKMPWIPGVMTPSEVMAAQAMGFSLVKLFPAVVVGGVALLKALHGPLPNMHFCPTGGIDVQNVNDFLSLSFVPMVGGSWLTPMDALKEQDWHRIEALAKEATLLTQRLSCT